MYPGKVRLDPLSKESDSVVDWSLNDIGWEKQNSIIVQIFEGLTGKPQTFKKHGTTGRNVSRGYSSVRRALCFANGD